MIRLKSSSSCWCSLASEIWGNTWHISWLTWDYNVMRLKSSSCVTHLLHCVTHSSCVTYPLFHCVTSLHYVTWLIRYVRRWAMSRNVVMSRNEGGVSHMMNELHFVINVRLECVPTQIINTTMMIWVASHLTFITKCFLRFQRLK